jgi:hypothetical protein
MNGTNSSAKNYDVVVIGSGATGHHGAIQAAKLGKKIEVVVSGLTFLVWRSTFFQFLSLPRRYDFQSRSAFGVYPDRPSAFFQRMA